METKQIWEFIFIGTCLRYLQDAKEGFGIHDEFYVLWNIDEFLRNLDELNLNVTKRASYKLENLRKKLSEKPKNSKLSYQEAEELSGIMEDIRKTLEAETEGHFVYKVSDKRIDIKKLLENVPGLFAPRIFNNCSEIARFDFHEAGKCIAFQRPTAAAFHLMRGTEAVLKLYYKKYIRSGDKEMWGPIISELRSKNKGRLPDQILLNNLDHLRHSFRNPTQHPNKIYDIDEVQDLFSICIDVVNRMCKVLNN